MFLLSGLIIFPSWFYRETKLLEKIKTSEQFLNWQSWIISYKDMAEDAATQKMLFIWSKDLSFLEDNSFLVYN